MPERIVSHSKYGRGVVKQSRYKDFELLVQFKDGLSRWIRFDELEQSAQTPQIVSLATGLSTPPINEAFRSRRMIEAFRLGIVPYDCVEDFTFGRQEESKELMNWLNSPEENVLLLVGEYGTGKTHLQHHIYWRALQEGFAVAYVAMDPNEVPFHKPKRVYSQLIQTFRYYSKKNKKRFPDFLKEVITNGAFKEHEYYKYFIKETLDENLWDWIEAKESIVKPYLINNSDYPKLPGLYDYSSTANVYCYLLSALGWAAKMVLGLKGLLLIFDEAEVIDMLTTSQYSKRGLNFFRALSLTAQNDKVLLEKPQIGCIKRNLDYSLSGIGRKIPFLYKLPCGLKLLFAFTPIDTLNKLDELRLAMRIDLQSLTHTALKRVFENICLLYENAYAIPTGNLTVDTAFQRVTERDRCTRLFVKGSVEALDLIRLNQKIG